MSPAAAMAREQDRFLPPPPPWTQPSVPGPPSSRSFPRSPNRLSFPPPPDRRSLPRPPYSRSWPRPPHTRSFPPPVPTRRSLPAFPRMVGVFPKHLGGPKAGAGASPAGGSTKATAKATSRRCLRMGMQGVQVGSLARRGLPLRRTLHRRALSPLVERRDQLESGPGSRHLPSILGEGADVPVQPRLRLPDLPESGRDGERI